MNDLRKLIPLLLLVLLVGIVLLRGAAQNTNVNPVVSALNKAPRGVMGYARWLESKNVKVEVDTLLPLRDLESSENTLLIVPPSEYARWQKSEVTRVMTAVYQGASLLILCDEEKTRNLRMGAFFEELQAFCLDGGQAALMHASPLPRWSMKVLSRGEARLKLKEGSEMMHLFADEALETFAAQKIHGQGRITLVASASVMANDTIVKEGNLAFLESVRSNKKVVFLEGHHRARDAEFIGAAFSRLGPVVATIAFCLLPLVLLLGALPRRGDGALERDFEPLASKMAARSLASLYARAKISPELSSPKLSHLSSTEKGES